MLLGQGLLTGLLTKSIGEVMVIRLGQLLGALGFVALLLADGFVPILLTAGFFMLAIALIGPALNAYLSVFGGDHQGSLMGLNMAFASLGRVFGPLWAGYTFDVNIAYPFVSGAVVLFIGFVFSLLALHTASSQLAEKAADITGVG
jgi:DHA1 family multidrug resistance protein-like MFS transporter